MGANVNINAGSDEFHTALQAATFVGNGKIAQMLLERGADANAYVVSLAIPYLRICLP
jgi:ankyrin repeat protein